MSDATPEKNTQQVVDRLRQMFAGSAQASQSRTEASKSHQFLLAVALNAFARNGARKPLTDLEQRLVDASRRFGYDDAELAAIGETFTATPAAARGAIFPARFAALGMETGYSLADLRADMPMLAQEAVRSPNLRVRDASRYMSLSTRDLERARSTLAEAKDVDVAQLQQYARSGEGIPEGEPEPGWSVICYGVPMPKETTDPAQTKGYGRIRVWASGVDCEKGTHEVGKDEPFFGFATTDDVGQRVYQSPEFSMDAGDYRDFPANTLWDATVAGGGLTIVVDGWEADNRNVYNKQVEMLWQLLAWLMDQLTIDDWADMVETVIGDLTGVGIPPWVIALAASVVAFIIRILSNPDDRLGTHPVLIPVPALAEMKARRDIVANNPFDVALRLLAQRLGYREGSMEYMVLWMALMLGAFNPPGIAVHMDHDDENHGIYDVYLKVSFP